MNVSRAKKKTESISREPLSRKIPGIANAIDIHVGGRVRLRRTLMGMSQEKLGEALGLTFQQVQKYERGANRIGASRLFDLSKILNVPVTYFFDEMPKDIGGEGSSMPGLEEETGEFGKDPLARRETLELVRAYYRIPNAQIRRKVFELAKSLSMAGDGEDD